MRRLIPLMLIILVLAASGCGEARYHLTVNRDGSGDIDLEVALDTLTLDLLGQVNADPLSSITGALEKEGYTVSMVQEGETTGLIARKHLEELTPLGINLVQVPGIVAAASGTPGDIQVHRGFYKTRYSFETGIDPVDYTQVRELGSLESYLLKQMDYEFILTLPIQPSRHNAARTADAGRTLVWQLIPGQVNTVLVEASHWNPAGLAFTVLILIILGAGGYWYYRKYPKSTPSE